MKSTKKTIALISIIVFSYLALKSMQTIQANPIFIPSYGSLQFGITSMGSNLRHLESIVELNVYDKWTYGNGTYWLYNSDTNSCEIPIIFIHDTGFWYSSGDINVSANGSKISYNIYDGYDLNLRGFIFNLTFNPNSTICLNIQWPFESEHETDYRSGVFDPTTEQVRFYYTGYAINGGKYWNNQSINHEKVIFNFYTENFFVEENLIAMNLTDYRLDDYDFSYLERRQAYISNIEKFPVETTATGYRYTLEFTEIVDNIYITIVNDNSYIELSGMGYFEIGVAVIIIVVIGRRIWKKKMKQAIDTST